MKKEQVNKTLSNFIDAYGLLLNSVVDCNELSLSDKQKFGEIICAAIYECHETIKKGNGKVMLQELEPINKRVLCDFDIN